MEEWKESSDQAQSGESVEELDYGHGLLEFQAGAVVHGHVVRVDSDQVLVDVGYKSEGIIPLSELSYRHIASADEVVHVGDEIEVVVLSVDTGEEGALRLSKRRADEGKAWERLTEAYESGEILQVPVVEAVKGGLVADVGTRGFIPASHVDRGFVQDLQPYVGQTAEVKVIELDRGKRRVILSRKAVLEEQRRKDRETTWHTLEEGQVRHGAVKSLTDFGAFVDLGGVDGLLHVSELSWGRVHHPSEVLHVGQELDVKILRVDREQGRISLGLKQVLANPWDTVAERYVPGATVEGRVVRIATFGAFVELEAGIDGLIHISQLAEHHVERPQQVVNVGDVVRCRILRVDPDEHRVSLSLRELEEQPRQQDSGGFESASGGMTIGDRLGDDWKGRFGE